MKPWLCGLLLVPGLSFSQTEPAPLAVFIMARTVETVDPATKKENQKLLKEKAKEAKERKRALEKALKAELGGDKDKWPEEKQEEFRQAEDAEKMILMELETSNVKQKDLDDSVGDMKRSIQGDGMAKVKRFIRVVDRPEEADLTAEVMGRLQVGAGGLVACMDCQYYLYLKIRPEAGVHAENLASLSPKSGGFEGARRIHQYKAEEPFWIIEAGSTGRWGNAANQAAGALNHFAEENRSVVKTRSGN
jgi:Skp family chaperone for outer membrane proteins